ncbi:MAG: alanine racemase, partial [Chlamydiota bacterium]
MLTFSIGLILLFSLAGFLIFVWKNKSSIPVSPIHSFIRPTEVKISLKNICHNYLLLRKNTNKPIIAVIKAHAYGCGSLQVVTALEKEGCDWFAVAFLHEALVLRKAKIRSNLLILGYTDVNEITAAIKNDIVVTVYDENIAKKYSEKAVSLKKNLRVHVKVKTGMGRLGVFSHQAAPFFRTIK